MNKQRHLKQILQVDKLSHCWLQALTNRLSLEYETSILKLSPLTNSHSKLKTGKKISFGDVTIGGEKKMEIKDSYESSKLGKVKSTLFIETYILSLLIYINPKEWDTSQLPCATLESLYETLAKENLPRKTFHDELRKIAKDLEKYESSILGYKGGMRIKKLQEKLVQKLNMWTGLFEWQDTGLKVDILPNLHIYFLKIFKNQELASIIIQKNWRRKKQLLIYNELLRIKKLLLSFSFKLNCLKFKKN